MHTPPGSHYSSRRYLTPFYSIALGLTIVLVLSACGSKKTIPSEAFTATPPGLLQPTEARQFGTQAHSKSTITPLPAVPSTPDIRTPSPLGVTAKELQGLAVTVWFPWNGATATSFQSILDEFNRTNKWGISVKYRGYEGYGSLDEAVEGGLAGDTLPDVLVDYGYMARHWDTSGVLADLVRYVDDSVWGLSDSEQSDFVSTFWAEDLVTSPGTSEPRRLGIPYYRSAFSLFYNHSWAEELGFPNPPATPQEFREQACTAAEAIARSAGKSSLGKGGWLITADPTILTGWIYSFNAGITRPDGEGYSFNTPETIQAFEYLKGLQGSGCAWYDSQIDPQLTFANRQALFIAGSLYDIPTQQAAMAKGGLGDEWLVIPFPSSTAPVMVTQGPSLMLTRSTPAQQLASWLVIEWLVYPPNQAKIVQQLGVYPTRQSTRSYLIHTGEAQAQWTQALNLLPASRGEPNLPSWNILRWALSDATAQLFSMKFGVDQLPELIENLDNLAEEVGNQVR